MYDLSAPQGWQCPICKRVYSPSTTMCQYCGNEETSVIWNAPSTYPGYVPPVQDWGNTKTNKEVKE